MQHLLKKEKKNKSSFILIFVLILVTVFQKVPTLMNKDIVHAASWPQGLIPKETWSDGSLLVKERTPFNNLEWTGTTVNGIPQTQVYEVNREKAHAQLQPYQSQEAAIAGSREYDKTKSTFYQPLTTAGDLEPVNSSWKFSMVPTLTRDLVTANTTRDPLNPSQNITDFYRTDYDASNWNSIAVPSSWQVQGIGADGDPYTGYYDPEYGYDPPYYTNIANPGSLRINGQSKNIFNGVPQFQAPNDYNPVGCYRKYFDVDKKWIDNNFKVFISFGGVEAAYYVYVNGQEVGYHEDSKTPGEFDITDLLNTDGKDNLLAVKVFRWSDASWIEDQDFLRLSGIFRDVCLMAAPPAHIRDYKVETPAADSTFTDFHLELNTTIHNYTSSKTYQNLGINVQVIDESGKDITAGYPLQYNVNSLAPGEEVEANGSVYVQEPRKWFPDDPYLYTLVIALYDKTTNEVYEYISQELGFRQFTFREADNVTRDNIRLNGEKVMIRGVNRHDTTPYGGRYVSRETYEFDLQTMKKHNINTIRTAHYPSDDYLYWLADKYGLMVICEANNECHSVSDAGNSTNENPSVNVISKANFFDAANDRVLNIVEKEKNRTSVMMWSLGNETGAIKEWENVVENIRPVDYTRPVQYEGRKNQVNRSDYIAGRSLEQRLDILSSMYWGVESARNDGNGRWSGTSLKLPFYQCEYAHAMGNSLGNLKEYWDEFRGAPYAQGGCIWEFVDHSVWTKLPDTPDIRDVYENGMYLGYGGDWGEGNHDGNFCADGLLNAKRDLYPEMQEVKKVYQEINFVASDDDLRAGKVRVRNESIGVNADVYDYKWTLTEDGKEIGSGVLDDVPSMPVDSGENIVADIDTVDLPIPFIESLPDALTPGAEYFLTVQACLKEDRIWAKAGYPIGEEQFILPEISEGDLAAVTYDKSEKIAINDNASALVLSTEGFSIRYDKTTGLITDYTANGEQLLSEGPRPVFWRAKTDNDNGWAGPGTNAWTNIDRNPLTPSSFQIIPSEDEFSVQVKITYSLTDVNTTSFLDMFYTVYFNGAVRIDTALRTTVSNPILRFGVDMKMPEGFENIDWLTRGPRENLSDRKTGAHIGQHSTTVNENFWGYIKPQDTGTRQDTRWMTLTGEGKRMGLMVAATGDHLFEANALHYTWRDLNTRHLYSLKPLNETVVSVSYGSRGTGGNSCGPETLAQYRLNTGNMSYSYTLIPIDSTVSANKYSGIARSYSKGEPRFKGYELAASVGEHKIDATLTLGSIWNDSMDKEEVMLVLAIYNKNGVMTGHKVNKDWIGMGDTMNVEFSLGTSDYTGCTYKILVWDAKTMQPIRRPISGGI